jgi:pSer/pThr/pTyr-binding forkhead associated (FHA) protein
VGIVLEILEGSSRGRVYELEDPLVAVGRAGHNSVALADYHLSGDHGQIFMEGDAFVYRDLRSTNGSVVERAGRRMAVDANAGWEITLHDGDLLRLGDPRDPVVIRVGLPSPPAEEVAEPQ